MNKLFQKMVFPRLRNQTFKSDDELYLYLVSLLAMAFAAGAHILLFFFMLLNHIPILPWMNVGSFIVYIIGVLLLTTKRLYAPASILLTIEIIVYTVVATFMLGSNLYMVIYILLALVLQMIIPYASIGVRSVMIILTWASTIAVIFLGESSFLVVLSRTHAAQLSVLNISLGVVGIVVALSVGNELKKVISNYNEMRLQEFRTQANTDPLTGLYNRRYANLLFEKMQVQDMGARWCVAILDIDDFKLVNDRYGHNVGDAVLRGLTQVMRQALRRTDLVIRWGGEEFLLLLGEVNLGTAHVILDKMRRNIEETLFQTDAGPLRITVSIGVAPLDVKNVQKSIEMCDERLYSGKHSGKNVVVI